MGNKGRYPNEPDAITSLSGRIYGFVEAEDDLAAIGVEQRDAGMLAWVTGTLAFWWFDADATDPASGGSVVVPAAGNGRWKVFPANDISVIAPLRLGGAPGARIIAIDAVVGATANFVPIRGSAGELTSAWFQTGTSARPTAGDLRIASGAEAVVSRTGAGANNVGLKDDGSDGWALGNTTQASLVNVSVRPGGGVRFNLSDAADQSGALSLIGGTYGVFLTVLYDNSGGQVQFEMGTNYGLNIDADGIISLNSSGQYVELQYNGTGRVRVGAAGLGFYGQAPAAQPADSGAITDNSGGSAGSAVATTGDATTDDNFATVVAKMNAIRASLRSVGLMA